MKLKKWVYGKDTRFKMTKPEKYLEANPNERRDNTFKIKTEIQLDKTRSIEIEVANELENRFVMTGKRDRGCILVSTTIRMTQEYKGNRPLYMNVYGAPYVCVLSENRPRNKILEDMEDLENVMNKAIGLAKHIVDKVEFDFKRFKGVPHYKFGITRSNKMVDIVTYTGKEIIFEGDPLLVMKCMTNATDVPFLHYVDKYYRIGDILAHEPKANPEYKDYYGYKKGKTVFKISKLVSLLEEYYDSGVYENYGNTYGKIMNESGELDHRINPILFKVPDMMFGFILANYILVNEDLSLDLQKKD